MNKDLIAINDEIDNTLIVRIDGHLTCTIRGVCVDIWDCTNEKVECMWIVQ